MINERFWLITKNKGINPNQVVYWEASQQDGEQRILLILRDEIKLRFRGEEAEILLSLFQTSSENVGVE